MGIIPSGAKDPKVSYRTINGRAETVDKAPSFRKAFAKRRCLIPANGFCEWRESGRLVRIHPVTPPADEGLARLVQRKCCNFVVGPKPGLDDRESS
jgi:hypothetical protein